MQLLTLGFLTVNRILPLILVLLSALLLNGCIIFGDPNPPDETKGWQADRLYEAGTLQMREKNFEKAIEYFRKIESRFPHGVFATQAQLEIAYAHYKQNDPILCLSAIDRFLKLHPNHPKNDYAYYLKGLATFNEPNFLEKKTRQKINDRDPQTLKVSFAAFKELTERFPKSKYVKDATLRMVYLVNQLAQHEMHVSRYYMNRKAYVAAANRAKYIVEYYPNSTTVEQALVMLVSAYDLMELKELKEDTLRVLGTNYPNNAMLTGKIQKEERIWWKFWESL